VSCRKRHKNFINRKEKGQGREAIQGGNDDHGEKTAEDVSFQKELILKRNFHRAPPVP